jgi:hypothetical protein
MEEQAGPLTSRFEGKLTEIRGIADEILVCGELAEDSHVLAEARRIIRMSMFYVDNYQRIFLFMFYVFVVVPDNFYFVMIYFVIFWFILIIKFS